MNLQVSFSDTGLSMIFVWTVFIQPVFGMAYDQEGYTNGQAAQPPQVTTGNNSLLCTPFGACEPCPADDVSGHLPLVLGTLFKMNLV